MEPNYIPSASVILLRKRNKDIEVLLLKKNSKITFGGSWVFPGGRIDSHDRDQKHVDFPAERQAVVRECIEETGLELDANKLTPISVWKTPVTRPKRFSTVFFIYNAQAFNQPIQIDNGEIVDFKWGSITDILTEHNAKKLTLAGPAFVTLSSISALTNLEEVWNHFHQAGLGEFTPRAQLNGNSPLYLYKGDDYYETLNDHSISECEQQLAKIESATKQHRLYNNKENGWKYINNLS